MLPRLAMTVLTSSAAMSSLLLGLGVRVARTRPVDETVHCVPLGPWQLELPSLQRQLESFDAPPPGGSA